MGSPRPNRRRSEPRARARGCAGGKRATLLRVLKLIGPERKILSMAVGTILFTTPVSLFFPAAVGKLLDVSTIGDPVFTPTTIAVALLTLFSVQGLFISLRDGLLAVAGERMAARLRAATFTAILRQETAFFDANRSGELINRLSSDTAVIQKAITGNIATGLRSLGMVVGCTAMLVYTSPKLALVSLCVIPPGGVVSMFLGRFMKRKQKDVQDALALTTQQAEEAFSTLRTVRQFARERTEAERYARAVLTTRDLVSRSLPPDTWPPTPNPEPRTDP